MITIDTMSNNKLQELGSLFCFCFFKVNYINDVSTLFLNVQSLLMSKEDVMHKMKVYVFFIGSK